MSDVPQRPRIRPATSEDWQKGHTEPAGQNPSHGSEAGRSPAVFDNSTYYEYIERHTGEQSISKAPSGNVFVPAGRSPFYEHTPTAHSRAADGAPGRLVAGSGPTADPVASQDPEMPPPPQFPPTAPAQSGPRSRKWLKVTAVIIGMTMVLALVAFFGIRWMAPSSGTVPVDVGHDESPSPSPPEDLVRPSQSPQEKLASYTKAGTERAADLEGQWVTQVSAKNIGLEADGQAWTAQDILDEYEANKVKYPGSILIHSGDWASYRDGTYWVTIVDTGYSDPEPALDECRSWGLDRDHCLAKRLVKDGSPKDNSAYLDE